MSDGTLFSGSRKESSRTNAGSATTEGGARQIYCAEELRTSAEAPPTRRSDVRDRSRVAGNQKQIAIDRFISIEQRQTFSALSLVHRHTRLLVMMCLKLNGYAVNE